MEIYMYTNLYEAQLMLIYVWEGRQPCRDAACDCQYLVTWEYYWLVSDTAMYVIKWTRNWNSVRKFRCAISWWDFWQILEITYQGWKKRRKSNHCTVKPMMIGKYCIYLYSYVCRYTVCWIMAPTFRSVTNFKIGWGGGGGGRYLIL